MRIFRTAAIVIAILAGPAYGQIGMPDKMGGTGYAKQVSKSCSVYANTCTLKNRNVADKCQAAGARCMQTGTFVTPQGKSFSGLAKN